MSCRQAEVEALREAFLAAMGLRDERGYQYHAGPHGLPLPIQCRHGDILFLPWHRAYLYFFERALQDLEGLANLPWWDWTTATTHRDGLPAAYRRTPARVNPIPLATGPAGWRGGPGQVSDRPEGGAQRRTSPGHSATPTSRRSCRGEPCVGPPSAPRSPTSRNSSRASTQAFTCGSEAR